MFDLSVLPDEITSITAGLKWTCDDIGMSDSTILLYEEGMALKIEKTSRSSKHEIMLLSWLDGLLPAPKIIKTVTRGGYSFLLMTRLSGEMACSDNGMRNIEDTVKALATGIKMLWKIDISNCPCVNSISQKLIQAKNNIDNNLVDINNFNPETFTVEGFKDVPDLYDYLCRHRPVEDLVFSHGDYCLPNVFISGSDVTGFLDWGNGGVADRWQDIALCVRSLRLNYVQLAGFSDMDYEKSKTLLFRELNLEPDYEKIRYFILLDELF